jgi:hypothetical protein
MVYKIFFMIFQRQGPGPLFSLTLGLFILGTMYVVSTQQKPIEAWAKNRREEMQKADDKLRLECRQKKDHILREIPGIGGNTPFCEKVIRKILK